MTVVGNITEGFMHQPENTAVLFGSVCQLNYGCGGLLRHQTWIFCMARSEAVDLHILQMPGSKSSWLPKGNKLEAPQRSGLQRQMRGLQRGIMKFHNAAKTEQCELVLEAEKSLAELLGQPNLDGDALCQLVRRCASWLHAPVIQTTAGADVETSPSTEEEHVNLQSRVRKLLIQALSHLDLSDKPTFQAVEAALLQLHAFLRQVDAKVSSSSAIRSDSLRQWLKLRELVAGSTWECSTPAMLWCEKGCHWIHRWILRWLLSAAL